MQFPIERLAANDYVMCYWQAGQGSFAWLIERNQQLYLFVVFNMKSLRYEHWAYENERTKVDTVRRVMATMGFHEVPIYDYYKNHKKVMEPLQQDIQTFEDTVQQDIEAMEAQQKKEQAVKQGKGTDPGLIGKGDKDNVTKLEEVKASKGKA